MLRSFRVANHRSIRAAQELVLLPAYDKSRPVTPVAAVYGANASGKSNLLDALRWMRHAVLDSFASWTLGAGVPRTPFTLDRSAAEPSEFSIDLMLDGVRHHYGFVVDDHVVREEWLHTFPKGRRRIIFERAGDDWTFGSTVRGPVDAARELTRRNALFLSVGGRSNITECEPVVNWMADGLSYAESRSEVEAEVKHALVPDSAWRQPILDLVRAADLGITDVRTDVPTDAQTTAHIAAAVAPQPFPWGAGAMMYGGKAAPQLLFFHGDHPGPLAVEEESAGTRTWLNLALPIVRALAGPQVLLVDEADTALHPHLARQLVNLFRDPAVNRRGAQLIFTCHDATMLDEDTLARDEIWFVEKDPTAQTTRLYSLADFRPRKHENTERRYLAGSYGAVPVLSEFTLRRALERGIDPDAA